MESSAPIMAYNVGATHASPLHYVTGRSRVAGFVTKQIGMWLVALLALGIIMPSAVLAQDIIGPETRRTEAQAGPYTVDVEAKPLPSLQSVQFIVQVRDAAAGTPVPDAKVTVHTSRQSSDESGYAHASPVGSGVYFATVKMDTPGVWDTVLDIEEPGGESYPVDGFEFNVIPPAGNPEAGYVFFGVAVILAAGAGYLVWRIRRNQRQRAERSESTAA